MLSELERLADTVWGFVFYVSPDSGHAQRQRAADLDTLARAPQLDAHGVGRLLGMGLQHRIYEYDENGVPMVLKIATPTPGLRYPSVQDAQEDMKFISQFFAPYMVEPAAVIPLDDVAYVIKQRRLSNFHSITADDLRNEEVRQQFLDILRRNQGMIKQVGRSLDFLGREGQRNARAALIGFEKTPTISNLVVEGGADGSPHIRIIDTDLENFRLGSFSLRDRLSRVAARLAVQINRWLIQHFFGIDILAPVS